MYEENTNISGITLIVIVCMVFLIGLFVAYPIYRVWQQGLAGQAKLREAEYSRQVKVVEAKARLESERHNAQSEIVRAGGVAESNRIVGQSIDDQYIRYLLVKTLDGAKQQIIYVPTESTLPITEANRLQP